MYIALKWLLILNILLWLALCINKILRAKTEEETNVTDFYCNINSLNEYSSLLWSIEEKNVNECMTYTYLQIILFGMIVLVSLCKNQNWIYWQSKLKLQLTYGYTVSALRYVYNKLYCTVLYCFKSSNELQQKCNVANIILFYFIIKCLMIERKKLIKAVSDFKHEHNENTKIHYKLEKLAIRRLPNIFIEDTQKRNQSYELSYMKLCCENMFLRSSLEKVMKEKKTVEINILDIIMQVFLTNNNYLKAYCSKFVVRTKDVLLKAEMELEVQRFLTESGQVYYPEPSKQITSNDTHSNYTNNNRLLEALHSTCKDEYIWAARDQNIVKFYDLDIESAGNLRKIRKYVAYYNSPIDHSR